MGHMLNKLSFDNLFILVTAEQNLRSKCLFYYKYCLTIIFIDIKIKSDT